MTEHRVRLGVHAGQQHCTFEDLRSLWSEIEAVDAFEWISVWDHFYPAGPFDPTGECLEGVALHGALAAMTERVRVGSLVYSSGYRHPAIMANAMATIDHISGGRLEFGLGAGWLQAEYEAYGIPYESPGTRIRRLGENVEIVRSLWTQETTDYDGEFYSLHDAYCSPKPVQSPPRIWMGGWGEKTMLPLVARLADAWNVAFVKADDWERKRDLVREHAAAAGRSEDAIVTAANVGLVLGRDDADVAKKTELLDAQFGPLAALRSQGFLSGTPQQVLDGAMRWVEAGVDWLILALRAPFDRDALSLFVEEVIPHLPLGNQP